MDCNKEEAERAKSIAVDKFHRREYDAAKIFAVKAQSLFPDLEGISQMISTLDVYIASKEVDHYAMLNVNPSTDEETIRKQYKKLALVHHPDKNKSVGAAGAFKIIREAYSILIDEAKRSAYEKWRAAALGRVKQNVPLHAQMAQNPSNGGHQYGNRTQSQPNGTSKPIAVPKAQSSNVPLHTQTTRNQSNGGHHYRNRTQSQTSGTSKTDSKPTAASKVQSSSTRKAAKRKSTQKCATFWTTCNHCNFHYEYVRLYANGKLLCDNCKKPFTANETAPPPGFLPSKVPCPQNQVSGDNVQNQKAHSQDAKESGPDDLEVPAAKKPRQGPSPNPLERGKNVASDERSGTGPKQYRQDPGKHVQAAYKSWSDQEKVPHSGTSNVDNRGHRTDAKAARVNDEVLKDLKRACEIDVRVGSQEPLKQQKHDASRKKKMNSMANINGSVGIGSASRTRDIPAFDHRKQMMAKSLQEIRSKVNAWKSEERGFGIDNDKNGKSVFSTNVFVDKTSTTTPMIVLDPDFHDFDNDRTERSFGDNEVWSAYDDKDGMPRLYALIHKVDSRKPFKLTISWLNSKTSAEFSSMEWVSSGFHKTCGEYWVGKQKPVRSINAFSQKVNFSKTKRGSILIFPQKDEVWALYKNWSSEWDKHTPKDVVEKYDMVKVLDDYSEENGISVAPLVKVVGFKTVFRPELDPHVIKRVPKEEMLRFSHRVPHHVLTGQESENAPKGCLELDPASTPSELLQVITEAREVASPR